jgi:4-hydroxybenzoate polyprenyltransferase
MTIPEISTNLLSIFRASRVRKILPLLLLMLNGALLTGEVPPILNLLLSMVFVLVVMIFGMQLNVLTDAELDRETKPHLLKALTRDRSILQLTITTEIALCLVLISLVYVVEGALPFFVLASVGVLSLLYSYNFIVPLHAAKYRLKVFWLSNLAVIWLSYFGIWFSGYLAIGHSARSDAYPWIATFISLSLMDYSVFLCECAADSMEERKQRYTTLGARLGQKKTVGIATFFWLVSLVWLVADISHLPVIRRTTAMAALLPCATLQGLTCLSMLSLSKSHMNWKRLDGIVDLSSWTARLVASGVLLIALRINPS